MNPESPPLDLEDLFDAALQLGSEAERTAFLKRKCRGNDTLHKQVVDLLRGHEAGHLLDHPVVLHSIDDVIVQPSEIVTEISGTVIDRYKLLEKLGEGGFGTVWVAEQSEPVKRRVALKIIKLGMDTKQVVARFDAERQALARMDHPNIAKVHDAGATETGRPYFVMERVKGIPITQFCDQEKLNTENRLDLFIKVCRAVQHAHQKGIIHRDLKPSNIMVTLLDGVPVPKVIDFGIAKATQDELTDETILTKSQQFIGTPSYMSPEQTTLSGSDIDTRSDVYSLGVLLYELLTGGPPFESNELLASGMDEMRRVISEKNPAKPSTRIRQLSSEASHSERYVPDIVLPTDLDWIVMKCLEKDRARRYDTANGLAMDLLRHLKHEPIAARPPSRFYRLQKDWQRNKGVFTAGIAVALSLIIGSAVALWQAKTARRERNNAVDTQGRLQEATFQLQDTLARQLLVRGQALCERGHVAAGLHWMVRAIESAPAAKQYLRRDIEDNLVAWSSQWVEPLAVLLTPRPIFRCGAFSPDGQQVITGTWGGELSVWSIASGEPEWNIQAHDRPIDKVAFCGGGERVLSASYEEDTVSLWSALSGKPLAQIDDGEVQTIILSPDHESVIIGGGTKATVYSTRTGQALTPPVQHTTTINCLAFSPGGELAVSCSDDGIARLWKADTGESTGLPVLNHSQDVNRSIRAVAFGPQGQTVATVCWDGSVWLWDVKSGKGGAPLLRPERGISSVVFHPGGKILMTTNNSDHSVRLWDTEHGEPVGRPIRQKLVQAASFSPNGDRILTVGWDATVRLWSTETQSPVRFPMRHHVSVVFEAMFSPNGKRIMSVAGGEAAVIWDAEEISLPVSRFESGFATATARFSGDERGGIVATGNRSTEGNGGVMLWDSPTHESLGRLAPEDNPDGGVWMVCFSPDGSQLVAGGTDGMARIWDVKTQQRLGPALEHENAIRAVAYSESGELIATGCFGGIAKLWSAETGAPIGEMPHAHFVEKIIFSPEDEIMLTACGDGMARAWLVATGDQTPLVLDHGAFVMALDISPDGQIIATGGRNSIVKFWSRTDGNQTGIVLPHEGEVVDLAFSPNGRFLLTVSWDRHVRLWSVATGIQIGPSLLSSSDAAPQEGTFTPDGKRVVIADRNSGAWILDLPPTSKRSHLDLRLWIEVMTRLEMDEQSGALTWIDNETLSIKRERLAALELTNPDIK